MVFRRAKSDFFPKWKGVSKWRVHLQPHKMAFPQNWDSKMCRPSKMDLPQEQKPKMDLPSKMELTQNWGSKMADVQTELQNGERVQNDSPLGGNTKMWFIHHKLQNGFAATSLPKKFLQCVCANLCLLRAPFWIGILVQLSWCARIAPFYMHHFGLPGWRAGRARSPSPPPPPVPLSKLPLPLPLSKLPLRTN